MANDMAQYPACPYPSWEPPLRLPLDVVADQPCPYLPGRREHIRAFATSQMPASLYHDFMDSGFRRSGNVIYQPACRGCRACLPIRVRVTDFLPSKSQRRCWKRNGDLQITVQPPQATDEKFALYCRYISKRHKGPMSDERSAFESFLYQSPVDTIEISHRDSTGRLLAIGICDVSPESLSSVYYYFEPEEMRRGLGIFGAMYEIQLALRAGIPFYYLGYWVKGCAAMEYKRSFRPCEILCPDSKWRQPEEIEKPQME